MFGLFTLQLPSSLQTRLTLMSNRQQGGAPGSVFAMGAIAGLICSPCTTAPLSAILLYIAQSGNMWLGGGTLYLYALGMGLPLMLITVFGNRLLLKWPMDGTCQNRFWLCHSGASRLLTRTYRWRRVGRSLMVTVRRRVLWLGVHYQPAGKHAWMRIVQIVLLAAALVCVRPLQDWAFGAPHTQTQAHLNFTPVASVDALIKRWSKLKAGHHAGSVCRLVCSL
jgi:thiol:disulfide interchange protein DsbD